LGIVRAVAEEANNSSSSSMGRNKMAASHSGGMKINHQILLSPLAVVM
jgi:hypothetical protein